MNFLDKLSNFIDTILSIVSGILMIFLIVMIGVNIIARFIFNSPIVWQYEATLICMSWVIFLGMAMAFRDCGHMRLTFVRDALSEKIRPYYMLVLDMLVFAFLAYAGWISISIVRRAMPTMYQTLPMISRGVFFMAFPIGCFCSLPVIIVHCHKRFTRNSDRQPTK